MKIAIFEDLPDGGAKRVVYEQAKHLSKKYRIYYYCGERSKFFEIEKYAEKTVEFDLSLPTHRGIFRPLTEMALISWLWPQYRRLAALMREDGVEVCITHPSQITQAPLLLKQFWPTIYYAQEWLRIWHEPERYDLPNEAPVRCYEKGRRMLVGGLDHMAVRSASRVMVNSDFTKQQFEKAYGIKAKVCYPGVDTSIFYPGGQKKQYFLFVGERERINGYDLVEEMMKLSPLPFVIRYVELKRRTFSKTDAEMADLYRQSVATLCLGEAEPFGLTAIESMACGTPVIAVNEGGYKETVRDGEVGRLISREAEELYKVMKWMVIERDEYERMSKRARAWAESNFSWEKHIKTIEAELEGLG